ncbi:hypothetical protein pdul_cds_782 [Pandoravirus dulcis]|uniref:Uncharacterized protein n=1 Tax=Pandoravirus dulcis TaxID=1349409 RepID=A0A291AUE0_9VIRU|nr:hypothetical protein pdul_cds_782 [Pandoravirus dulcis]ATE82547.1 hypothetical protein pdul_cds_782 [Pandoravirus dulcis]
MGACRCRLGQRLGAVRCLDQPRRPVDHQERARHLHGHHRRRRHLPQRRLDFVLDQDQRLVQETSLSSRGVFFKRERERERERRENKDVMM